MKITNVHGVSLPLAVWCLYDEYDYNADPLYISATSLLAPTKQLILKKRIPLEDRQADVSDFISAGFGHAIHDSIQKAWENAGPSLMKKLGYPEALCDRIVINPTDEQIKNGSIPIWIEQRTTREFEGYKISGKFDMVADGALYDFKSTSVYSYIHGSKDEDYALQGSIYRWLNPERITDDFIRIQFLFTDWKKSEAKSNPNYPQLRVMEHKVKLLSIEETEAIIRNKIGELSRYKNVEEELMPRCTDKELWKDEPVYKYYADPNKTSGRSTKNFTTFGAAMAHKTAQGKGVVITVEGEAKRCGYCPAFDICKQKDEYFVQ